MSKTRSRCTRVCRIISPNRIVSKIHKPGNQMWSEQKTRWQSVRVNQCWNEFNGNMAGTILLPERTREQIQLKEKRSSGVKIEQTKSTLAVRLFAPSATKSWENLIMNWTRERDRNSNLPWGLSPIDEDQASPKEKSCSGDSKLIKLFIVGSHEVSGLQSTVRWPHQYGTFWAKTTESWWWPTAYLPHRPCYSEL